MKPHPTRRCFYSESAKLKLEESGLTGKPLNAITHENTQRLLA